MRIHVVLNLQRSSADCLTNNIQILQSITRRGQARCAVLNALPESALKAAWSSQLREAWPVLTGPSEYGRIVRPQDQQDQQDQQDRRVAALAVCSERVSKNAVWTLIPCQRGCGFTTSRFPRATRSWKSLHILGIRRIRPTGQL
jgi:hypothetical protein